jgi:phosphoribosylformylglycinamidine synthase subunit PurL
VGMVGKLPDAASVPRTGFAEPGHAVALVGPFRPAPEGSELEKLRGRLADGLPEVDLAEQAGALGALREAVRSGSLATVHDVADGGVAVALAECCIEGGIGARVALPSDDATALFGEAPGGAVLAGPREAVDEVPNAQVIGEVGGDALEIIGALRVPVADLRGAYEGAIPAALAAA